MVGTRLREKNNLKIDDDMSLADEKRKKNNNMLWRVVGMENFFFRNGKLLLRFLLDPSSGINFLKFSRNLY